MDYIARWKVSPCMAYILTRDQCSHNVRNALDLSTLWRKPAGARTLVRETAELLWGRSAWCVQMKYALSVFASLQQIMFSGSLMKDSSTTHQICSIPKSSTSGNVKLSDTVTFGKTESWSFLQDVVSGWSPERTDDPRVLPLRAQGKMQQVSPGDSVVLWVQPSLCHWDHPDDQVIMTWKLVVCVKTIKKENIMAGD